jgi:hypothetical protein
MKTGQNYKDIVAFLMALLIYSSEISYSLRYKSSISGLIFAKLSINSCLFYLAKSITFDGTSFSIIFSPLLPSKYIAFILTKSTNPFNSESDPIGI